MAPIAEPWKNLVDVTGVPLGTLRSPGLVDIARDVATRAVDDQRSTQEQLIDDEISG